MPDVEEVAEALYGVRPDEFVAARGDYVKQARAAGDRGLAADVTALRKPSTAAWVVNLMVRRARDRVEALLDLGESLRTAQAALAGDQLKELGRQRAQVVAAMAREGRRLAREAGHPVSAGIEEEVMETLRAALADPRAAQAVRTGRLTTSLSYSGLGEVDLEGVVALAPRRAARAALRAVRPEDGDDEQHADDEGDDAAPVRPAPVRRAPRAAREPADDAAQREAERRREEERAEAERRRREEERLAQERREARAALADAERAFDEATAAESLASDALDDARADQERAQRRVAELEDALRRAQEEAGEATAAVRPRKREHDSARHALDVARRALDRARAHADRLDV